MRTTKENTIQRYDCSSYEVIHSPIARKYVIAPFGEYEQYLLQGKFADIFDALYDYVPLHLQKHVMSPEDYTLLTVLPNNICNFTCSYCYSAGSRNGAKISQGALQKAISYFVNSKPYNFPKTLTISFMGGGEPFLSWDIVKDGIIYAQNIAKERRIKLSIRIISNGSICTNEILDFLRKHKIAISISFEILPEIQNKQRRHFDLVYNNIRKFIEANISVQINSTITLDNVARMEEMITKLHADFPQISNAMFEPVVAESLFKTPQELRDFYQQYIQHFINTRKLADLYDIELTSFAYLRTIFPLQRACPGELCVTANEDITGCYCVATPQDNLFARTHYGSIGENGLEIDKNKWDKLLNWNVYSKPECQDCDVKWNCGGGCFHQMNTYSQPYQQEVCTFTKSFIEAIIKYKVERYLNRKNIQPDQINKPMLFMETIS